MSRFRLSWVLRPTVHRRGPGVIDGIVVDWPAQNGARYGLVPMINPCRAGPMFSTRSLWWFEPSAWLKRLVAYFEPEHEDVSRVLEPMKIDTVKSYTVNSLPVLPRG
jgi:hypothetical protein